MESLITVDMLNRLGAAGFIILLVLWGLYRAGVAQRIGELIPKLGETWSRHAESEQAQDTLQVRHRVDLEAQTRAFEMQQASVHTEQLGHLLESDHTFIRDQIAVSLRSIEKDMAAIGKDIETIRAVQNDIQALVVAMQELSRLIERHND